MCTYMVDSFTQLKFWCFAGKLVLSDTLRGGICAYLVDGFRVLNTCSWCLQVNLYNHSDKPRGKICV